MDEETVRGAEIGGSAPRQEHAHERAQAVPRRDIDLGHFERLLLTKQDSLERSLAGLKEHTFGLSLKEQTGEDSSYDQHSADLALPTFERGKDLGLKDGMEAGLARIRLALERIHRGAYGNCVRCKQPIAVGRLEAAPEAELCIDCARAQEVAPRSRRPVEEQVPRRPMGGFETLADDVNPLAEERLTGGKRPRPR